MCLGCFVSGTGTVASWGWLRKTWIVYRLASNTASEDDMQYFQKAIQESTEFEGLANQWQNICSLCHCSSQCWSCRSERSRYAARIRIAIRRVKDGMELPPWVSCPDTKLPCLLTLTRVLPFSMGIETAGLPIPQRTDETKRR